MKEFSLREGLIVAGILFLVFLVWILSRQTPEPFPVQDQEEIAVLEEKIDADWTTYISDEYDFSIKFPKEWKVAVLMMR